MGFMEFDELLLLFDGIAYWIKKSGIKVFLFIIPIIMTIYIIPHTGVGWEMFFPTDVAYEFMYNWLTCFSG